MKAADPSVNFALYDSVMVYHAGLDEESSGNPDDYWSSRWYGLSMTYDGKTYTSGIVVPEAEVPPYGTLGVTCTSSDMKSGFQTYTILTLAPLWCGTGS